MTPGRSREGGRQATEQAEFAASLHGMLATAPGAARRWAGGDPADGLDLCRKLAAAGVTALAVPERHGGLGASPLDVVVACEELGHHALPGPVAEMIQMHGAIGITWEHDAHRYFKRAHGAALLFGGPAGHVARIAAAVIG
jgi:alkylation response protein AidB-like acyl-CoA dehydrogenase